MAELGTVEAPKNAGYVVTASRNTAFMNRIEADEKEIEELEKMQREGRETKPQVKEPVKQAAEPEEKEEKLSAEEATYKKRYGDLRRHMNELTEKLKDMEARLESAQKEGRIVAPKNDADVAAWMKKYPDVAAIVEAIADKKASEKFAGAEARLKQIDEMSAEAERKKNEAEIRAVHKDFDELRDSDAFHNWADEQPKWVKDALYENADDPKSVIKVIDLYKFENGLDTRGRKSAAKDAASAIVTKRTKIDVDADGGGKTIYESQVQKMSDREYEKRQDEIMEAIRNGTFVYDISGGAR
jgi:hypothetical protein